MDDYRILFVDDEPHVLSAFERMFRKSFAIDTTDAPGKALEMVQRRGPYAVVVSDIRMPGMNGIELLSRIRTLNPDTVRIALTGFADLETTIRAVNEGHIFRFLTKPCSHEHLDRALRDGLQQYRLIRAEKDLLEKTLKGSIRVLTEVLALLRPEAFDRSARVANLAASVAKVMGVEEAWEVETAALLSQIGMVTLPDGLVAKVMAEEELQGEERRLFERHPFVASNLIGHIPRMAQVAEVISLQEKRFDGSGFPEGPLEGEEIPLGARILKVCLDYEALERKGFYKDEALGVMKRRTGWYDATVLAALDGVLNSEGKFIVKAVGVEELLPGMVLAQDLMGADGRLLLAKGRQINQPVVEKLKAVASAYGVREPINVFIPLELVLRDKVRPLPGQKLAEAKGLMASL